MKKLIVVTILILTTSIVGSARADVTSEDETSSIENQSGVPVGRPFRIAGEAEFYGAESMPTAYKNAKIDAARNAQSHCLPLSYRRTSDFVITQRWYGMVRVNAEYVCVSLRQ